MTTATAQAFSNIAFIKYWGNRDHDLRIPANGSISMNLEGLETRTCVTFDASLEADELIINRESVQGDSLDRVSFMLERVRKMAGIENFAKVESENNFPMGAGIASSASAYAALALASTTAAGLSLEETDLSRLARTGSGSAARSVPGGFVEWQPGSNHQDSFALSIASVDHWDIVDCVAIISTTHKSTGSTQGHHLADTSPLQTARVEDAPRRIEICRTAVQERDFNSFARIVEQDCNMMHAVMMTSSPPLMYWQPPTVAVIHAVQTWRSEGLPCCYTIDAGPNVHVICPSAYRSKIVSNLHQIPGIQQILTASPGGPARLLRGE